MLVNARRKVIKTGRLKVERKEEARSILEWLIRERVFEEVDERENMGQVRRGVREIN